MRVLDQFHAAATLALTRVGGSVALLPTDDPQSGDTAAAVESALDIASLVAAMAIGAIVGLVISLVGSALLRLVTKRTRLLAAIVRRTRGPSLWAFLLWGAWAGMMVALSDTDLSALANGRFVAWAGHGILILAILAATRVAWAAAWVIEDAAHLRQEADAGRSRRFETQAQVLRRLTQLVVIILGLCFALFTFPEARQAMATLLASAGVISVVAGLAAQSTLGNVFAGLQLAFTDAIRVGDVVVAGPKGDSGAIEEITLSYVVVRVWDERRLVIPSTYFTTTTFENWTRRAAKQLGTVELRLDWSAPLALIRAKVEEILRASDLWDGRTWAVQVTDSDRDSMTVRILVSAADSGALWDLRCHIRETLVQWIATEEPWARPVQRYEPREVVTVEKDPSREVVARLASELSGIAADATAAPGAEPRAFVPGPVATPATPEVHDAVHAARLTAARRKAKKARRRAMAQRQRDLADGRDLTSAPVPEAERTRVMTVAEVHELVARLSGAEPPAGREEATTASSTPASEAPTGTTRTTDTREAVGVDHSPSATTGEAAPASALTTTGAGSRLYSGSPDAEERHAIFAGPGEEVIAEREAVARRRAQEAEEERRRAASHTDAPRGAKESDGDDNGAHD